MSWLGSNIGTILAIAAILAAWLIYRVQQEATRRGLLDAVEFETRLAGAWLTPQYDFGLWPEGAWWLPAKLKQAIEADDLPVPIVNRLSTVAVDAAIAQGPALFINPQIVLALVHYRQRVEQLNQLIDNATVLQQVPELWKKPLDPNVLEHFALAVAWIHWVGIGTISGKGNLDGTHTYFVLARAEVEREMGAGRFARWMWFAFGRTWPRLKYPPMIGQGTKLGPGNVGEELAEA